EYPGSAARWPLSANLLRFPLTGISVEMLLSSQVRLPIEAKLLRRLIFSDLFRFAPVQQGRLDDESQPRRIIDLDRNGRGCFTFCIPRRVPPDLLVGFQRQTRRLRK